MKLRQLSFRLPLVVICALWSSSAIAQTASPGVTGGGTATFTTATSYNGVALSGLDFGTGLEIPGDTSATGNFHATLQGTAGQSISVDGHASSGSTPADGSATFSGTCTVDMGNGSAPSTGVAFTVKAVPDGSGKGTLTLTLGTAKLAAATIQDGILSIRR